MLWAFTNRIRTFLCLFRVSLSIDSPSFELYTTNFFLFLTTDRKWIIFRITTRKKNARRSITAYACCICFSWLWLSLWWLIFVTDTNTQQRWPYKHWSSHMKLVYIWEKREYFRNKNAIWLHHVIKFTIQWTRAHTRKHTRIYAFMVDSSSKWKWQKLNFQHTSHKSLLVLTLDIRLNKFSCSLEMRTRFSTRSCVRVPACVSVCVVFSAICYQIQRNIKPNPHAHTHIHTALKKETDKNCIVFVTRAQPCAWSKSVYFNCFQSSLSSLRWTIHSFIHTHMIFMTAQSHTNTIVIIPTTTCTYTVFVYINLRAWECMWPRDQCAVTDHMVVHAYHSNT